MEAVAEKTTAVKNVPALRFPEFEGEWGQDKLDDLVEFKSGGTPSMKHPEYWDGDIPWISASSMYGKFYTKSDRTVTELGLANGTRLAPKGSLLLLVRGSMLFNKIPIGIAGVDVSFNQDVKALITKTESNTEFVYQWFLAKQNYLLNTVTGTGIGAGKLDTDELKNLKLHLPTLPEQQKIASFLGSVDLKIEQLTKKKGLLEAYKKGVMQRLFSSELGLGGLTDERISGGEDGANHILKSQNPTHPNSDKLRFKDDNGNNYPDWEVKRAKEVFRNHSNKKHNGDLPILAITQDKGTVYRDSIDLDIKSSEASIKSYKIVEKGDFIISLRSFQGGIEYSDLTGICSPAYTILKPNIPINHTFFKYYFKKESFIKQLSNTVVGIRDGKQISYDAFAGMKLPLPCLEEQTKIANFLTSLDKKISYTSEELEQARAFKKGLLQQMFV